MEAEAQRGEVTSASLVSQEDFGQDVYPGCSLMRSVTPRLETVPGSPHQHRGPLLSRAMADSLRGPDQAPGTHVTLHELHAKDANKPLRCFI